MGCQNWGKMDDDKCSKKSSKNQNIDKNSLRSSRTLIDAKLLLGWLVGNCCACELNLVLSIGNSQMIKKFAL
jgi:hypothetical protein